MRIYLPLLLFLFVGWGCKTSRIPVLVDISDIDQRISTITNSLVELPDTVQLSVQPLMDSAATEIIISTFLGGETRNYYGNLAPDKLNVKWKLSLGTGKTKVGSGTRTWSGAGWTGQPLMVSENGKKYIIQGAYDHNLRKIDIETQQVIWKYKFDDVLKGTGSLWYNKKEKDPLKRLIVFQGSRYGYENKFDQEVIDSYRAVSYFTGEEYWKLNSRKTDCYSRDVDASGLIYNDTLFIGLENGLFTVIEPKQEFADTLQGILQPEVVSEHWMYTMSDVRKHRRNVVTESSPSRIGNRIYVASGSGHVYGYNIEKDSIDWDFYIGSDIDGTAIVTEDSCLLISVEKQYIEGRGGILKLDPRKDPENAVVWYKPVSDANFAEWLGGIIGSVGTNHSTKPEGFPSLAATAAIDGYLYVVNTSEIKKNSKGKEVVEIGFDGKTTYPTPIEVFKTRIGSSISTPIFVGDKLIVAGYSGIHLFKYTADGKFTLLDKFSASFESTPISIDGRVYVASRNGFLYCFGD